MTRRLGRGARTSVRARLPALCCGSRQGYDPLAQLQAMLPGTRGEAGVTRPLLSQSRDSTSPRGLSAAARDAQSRPAPRLKTYSTRFAKYMNILRLTDLLNLFWEYHR
jgi:hypothetical protein